MIWLLYPILLIPAAAFAWIWHRHHPSTAEWAAYRNRVGILFAVGLFIAGPFITRDGLGTGEAYNYSLATADAVLQFRAGVFPVLVGQSEYAFNGRIHPIRTAPYMAHFAGFLDLLTFHRLGFWALQNLTIALSLIAGIFVAYAMLRWSTSLAPPAALPLACAYGLAPGVLAAAYSMDLYMTVMTIPFVPVVLGSCVRTLRGDRSFGTYVVLAAALAAAWLGHPPVAFWLTVGVLILQAPLVIGWKFRNREFWNAIAGGTLCVAMAGFAFASALTIHSYHETTEARETVTTVGEVARVFSASLRPVSPTASLLSDFQLGYGYAGILLLATFLGLLRKNGTALLLIAVAGFFLALTLPVPGLNAWLWSHAPTIAGKLTSHWPMQRLYLLIAAVGIFALGCAGGVPSFATLRFKPLRDAATLVLVLAVGWTVYQAWHYVRRGYSTHQTTEHSQLVHRAENINPTIISYAFFDTPPSFINGVMDPLMEFRILRPATGDTALSNWNAPEAFGEPVQRGQLHVTDGAGDIAELAPKLRLPSGSHFRIDFSFLAQPLDAVLQLHGPHTFREYKLPQAGGPEGFGMLENNGHRLSLWTTAPHEEDITLHLAGSGLGEVRALNLADFTLRRIDETKLPVRPVSWIPLRMKVQTPEAGYVETPRLFIQGYAAQVDGKPVRVQTSPDGLAMFPVPAGTSTAVLTYPGPGVVRSTFWLSFITFAGVMLLGGLRFWKPSMSDAWALRASSFCQSSLRYGRVILLILAAVVASAYGLSRWRAYEDAAGPLRIRLILPLREIGRSQPLVTTGKPSAGTFIFMKFTDKTHLQVGMDVWGLSLWVSPPVAVDYFAEHEFVVSSGALYPPGHPKLKNVSSEQLEKLRQRITVTLDGQTVLDQPVFSYESKLKEITVGESRIGVSNTEAKFVGQILSVERMPIPAK